MCGIAGVYFYDRGLVPERALLRAMIRALRHRGPDGEGIHVEPGIGMGHARLSIIDLAGGSQPLANKDDNVWITYNGEVFNYLELRDWLLTKGHVFRTHSDTEVLVHLYEELGDRFIDELNGQFAFSLWDRRRQRMLLVRDRAGILPLYYAELPKGVLFASEVKALAASGMVSPQLDPVGLDELFTFWAPVAPRTVFSNVSQLQPGELIVLSDGKKTSRKYWSWSFPEGGGHRRAATQQLKGELYELLSDASALRLRADVPVGAYLSGGLDSSALVALLKRRVPDTLHTFSIGFEDASLDESVYQKQVADSLGTQHHHFQCTHADIARNFPATILHAESPVLRTAPAPMRLLSGSVRQSDIRVVLTGEGADEVFGGYDIFKESKVRQFWARNPDSSWRAGLLKRLYPYLELTSAQNSAYLREFFGIGLDNPSDPCFSHLPRWATTAQCKLFFSDDWRAQTEEGAVDRLRSRLPAEMHDWNAFNRSEYVEAITLLPSYLLASQGDRMLMANSIEGRFQFLDHRVIEFANSLHPSYKMKGLREKFLLKETMRPFLPAEIIGRHKQPYRAPDAAAFLSAGAPDYVEELLGEARIRQYGYFDPQRVNRLVSKLRRSRVVAARDNMAFVGILSTQLWHAIFIDRRTEF